MNILPKKRWHVRTKDNIARVRRDEAEAAAKAQEEQKRVDTADREARLNVLRQKSKQNQHCVSPSPQPSTSTEDIVESNGHINLFTDLEHHSEKTNREHDEEVKQKKEEYEKQIGYLTYLGQDTNEALKKKNWYELAPSETRFSWSFDIKDTYNKLVLKDDEGKPKTKSVDIKNGEVNWKAKQSLDPFNLFKKHRDFIKTPDNVNKATQKKELIGMFKDKKQKRKKKKKKRSSSTGSSSISSDNEENRLEKHKKLQKLREERLKREKSERERTEKFLLELSGMKPKEDPKPKTMTVKPKYNSQYNPEFAKQNYR